MWERSRPNYFRNISFSISAVILMEAVLVPANFGQRERDRGECLRRDVRVGFFTAS